MDIITSFLQALGFDRNILVYPPKEETDISNYGDWNNLLMDWLTVAASGIAQETMPLFWNETQSVTDMSWRYTIRTQETNYLLHLLHK